MKLLKIETNQGLFMAEDGKYIPIDKITKEQLLRMVNLTLSEEVEFDEYDVEKIPNLAHQIIYKSVHDKLSELRERKSEFIDQSERLFLKDYERYKQGVSQQTSE
jgi:hypothetical protein